MNHSVYNITATSAKPDLFHPEADQKPFQRQKADLKKSLHLQLYKEQYAVLSLAFPQFDR